MNPVDTDLRVFADYERDFSEDPIAVLKAEAEHDHSAPMDHGTPAAPETAGSRPWWQFWRR